VFVLPSDRIRTVVLLIKTEMEAIIKLIKTLFLNFEVTGNYVLMHLCIIRDYCRYLFI